MKPTTSSSPSSAQAAELKRKRQAALRQMRAQAKRDGAEAIAWLREQVERYQSLDPASSEAEELGFLFTNCLIIWGHEARFETWTEGPCDLSLDLDCEAAEDYDLDQLRTVSASVIYNAEIYVHVSAIEEELHRLLGAVQGIVRAEEERQ